jgi:hypothetical protein
MADLSRAAAAGQPLRRPMMQYSVCDIGPEAASSADRATIRKTAAQPMFSQ